MDKIILNETNNKLKISYDESNKGLLIELVIDKNNYFSFEQQWHRIKTNFFEFFSLDFDLIRMYECTYEHSNKKVINFAFKENIDWRENKNRADMNYEIKIGEKSTQTIYLYKQELTLQNSNICFNNL